MKQPKRRLDQILVEKGLAENPSKARARIMAGDVIVNDHRVDKPGEKFNSDVMIRLKEDAHPYVSRGGIKLHHALDLWPSTIKDAICMDVGASTGGFTEALLTAGAGRVYAIDVGYGQLAEKLRTDPRVINMERTHILHVLKNMLSPVPSIAVIDVSFISLEKVLPHVVELLTEQAMVYALIKPQFEAGPENVEKGGIVKSPIVHERVVEKIRHLARTLSLTVLGIEKSPIQGAKGNVEFLIALKRG
jgi:23S rRNA (cytidine1920-2'-O)/16S rRNA (cytidine1409-2'-O)-methyltransferase